MSEVEGEVMSSAKVVEEKCSVVSKVDSSEENVPSESSTKEINHDENVHYEGDECIYTDPASKYQYVWDSNKSEWTPRINSSNTREIVSSTDNSEDLQEKNADVSAKDYKFDGESYTYTDKQRGVTYRYDKASQKWVEKQNETSEKDEMVEYDSDDDSKTHVVKQDMSSGTYSFEGDNHLYTDPNDGTVYLWDKEKNAWFPKVDEDFLAHYQMNYGFTETAQTTDIKKADEDENKANDAELALKRKMPPKEPTWFEMDDEHNTKVYVSNLPLDITEEEFLSIMQKYGLVMRDLDTGRMKVKLYTEPGTNHLKGDALCTYIKVESVELALKLLDGSDVRGKKIKVERAKFQMKGTYDPNLKPRKKKKKDKEKMKKIQEKLFDWRPDKLRGERSKHERVVIVKNLFEPAIFEKEVSLILEYQQDLREECSKCGDVRKVVIYDRNPEGVAQISFREPEEADECIKLLNGRWFGQRKITAETWDGKTKYKIVETEEETQKRLQGWSKFLEEKQSNADPATKSADPAMKSTDPATISADLPTKSSFEGGETKNSDVLKDGVSNVSNVAQDSDSDHDDDDDDEESVKKDS